MAQYLRDTRQLPTYKRAVAGSELNILDEASAFKINQTYSYRCSGATFQVYESGMGRIFQEPETQTNLTILATEVGPPAYLQLATRPQIYTSDYLPVGFIHGVAFHDVLPAGLHGRHGQHAVAK